MNKIEPLRSFVQEMTQAVEKCGDDEAAMLREGKKLLAHLIARDDWLPQEFAQDQPDGYRQYLLYCDPLERFSVVSFVWLPGHRTPIHDHTVWGLVGVMRGEELCEEYGADLERRGTHPVPAGAVDRVSPRIGDIHVVSNATADRTAVSIHVYGANIGAVRRHTFDAGTGQPREFVSGYHNSTVPNLWDRSREASA